MKRAVLYSRVSTLDQNPLTQLLDLRRLAEQRGFEIVHEYTDKISGAKAKRPALDQMLAAAHRREFDVVLVWAGDRLARSVRHFLEVLDTLNHLGIEFVSFRENLDTGSGWAMIRMWSGKYFNVTPTDHTVASENRRQGCNKSPAIRSSPPANRGSSRIVGST